MDVFAFEIAKGSWGPDCEFNTDFLRKMLKENNLEISFTPYDLLKVWRHS